MSDHRPSQRVSLEKAIRALRGLWDTQRALTALRDAGHEPEEKHTRQILRDLASSGLLVKVQDRPVRYRTEPMNE
ncbi:hypothetical protein [Streptomyces sp. SP17KL33]|uniref:hypothetical protein n=1 Tax=Streptomyces sp. SP17KL33 TaxID=3002534 RepID=UPI002E79E377|nr:hypothetical protein [Streptomyces sp. SP17KL33]MEE1829433.1 hypothetical protein [Streptomyces sp. SP17KL33]